MTRRVKVVAGVAVAAVVGVVAVVVTRDDAGAPAASSQTAAEAVLVQRMDLVVSSDLDGEVSYGSALPVPARRTGTVTEVAAAGSALPSGSVLYRIDEWPVVVLDGQRPAYRAFDVGMADGADVRQLEASLAALGHDPGAVDEKFTSQTAAAVRALQRAIDSPEDSGRLELGDVVFAAGGARVVSVVAGPGSIAPPGAQIAAITGGRPEVTFGIDPSDAGAVAVGDEVEIDIGVDDPVTGVVSTVSSVAVTPLSASGVPGDAEVQITVRLPDQNLTVVDGQPVTVSVETDRVADVLAVPVRALLALAEGGYAVEVVTGSETRLAAIELGRFVDAMVEIRPVEGSVEAGDRVLLPSR